MQTRQNIGSITSKYLETCLNLYNFDLFQSRKTGTLLNIWALVMIILIVQCSVSYLKNVKLISLFIIFIVLIMYTEIQLVILKSSFYTQVKQYLTSSYFTLFIVCLIHFLWVKSSSSLVFYFQQYFTKCGNSNQSARCKKLSVFWL